MPQDGKKTVFDRIQSTENCFGDLCTELSSFAKKKARYESSSIVCTEQTYFADNSIDLHSLHFPLCHR